MTGEDDGDDRDGEREMGNGDNGEDGDNAGGDK